MKKIAILTFSNANNYGAMLQAYALKTALLDVGGQAAIVNYTPKPSKIRIKDIIKNILFFWRLKYTDYKFNLFKKPYLTDMPELKRNQLPSLNNKFDIFVAGSDQVWNMKGSFSDSSFLLDFVTDDKKKYSYAASFGKTVLPEDETTLIKPYLKLFEVLSVREACTVPLAEELAGKKAMVNIDPTLLLKKQDWQKIAVLPKEKEYVLLYVIYRNDKIFNFVKELSARTGLEIIMLSASPRPYKGIRRVCPSPQEWLGYFLNAKHIVTDSFHGLAFSINFNKDFYVNLRLPNCRLENLLDLTNLRQRVIGSGDYSLALDWDNVNSTLDKEREKAFDYLRTISYGGQN